MNPHKHKIGRQFAAIFAQAVQLAEDTESSALLVLLEEGPTDWAKLRAGSRDQRILVVADAPDHVAGAAETGLDALVLHMADNPVYEKLTQALLESVAQEILEPGGSVVAIYSGFEAGKIDSLSYIRLDDHLGRLTARDLRQLGSRVPLETLKTVVDLAVAIGREGREGKPVGTMFVVGDSRKVMASSQPSGFDPVRGYGRRDRSLHDHRVREGIKEVAQLDGAFIVSSDGTVEASCRLVEMSAPAITLSKGLGSRHWAAAAITKKTDAVAVVVSESTGTVRIFQNGEVVLRVEPFRRAMKWKDFEYEPPAVAE
jgi:DNA integrity scanning protein DisA with diadenylate cyclase activity